MTTGRLAANIREKFTEQLANNQLTTSSIIKVLAMHFKVAESVVIDAVTKGQPVRKGARK
jgi:hypothetical protein